MPDSVAISTLESAAAGLGVLLNDWIHDHIDKPEPSPSAADSPEDLDLPIINDAIQSLWRLVSIHKSIQQLKTPPPNLAMVGRVSDPTLDPNAAVGDRGLLSNPDLAFGSDFAGAPSHYGSPTSSTSPMSASADTSLHPASAGVSAHPDPASAGLSRLSSTRLQPSNFSVPSVPSVPTMHSLEAIIAKTQQLYAETASLLSASGLPLPDPDPTAEPATPDQPVMKLLDIIAGRPSFPGSGNSLDSFRADLVTCPP